MATFFRCPKNGYLSEGIHPDLVSIGNVLCGSGINPEVRMDGKQLFWVYGACINSVTVFSGEELDHAKKLAYGCNDIRFVGNIRFSSTVD